MALIRERRSLRISGIGCLCAWQPLRNPLGPNSDKRRYVNSGAFAPPKQHYKAESGCRPVFLPASTSLQRGLAVSLSRLGTAPLIGSADWQLCYHANAESGADAAGAMGGFLVGRPRQAKILWIASGVSMAASILIRPPQRGQARTSNSNTRSMRVAHW
jgi:hypothetical protein